LPSKKIFDSVKRVKKDIEKSFNKDTLKFFREKNIINDWEYNFYLDIYKKRKLTIKQKEKKKEINKKCINIFMYKF
jgi:hypothetical protein